MRSIVAEAAWMGKSGAGRADPKALVENGWRAGRVAGPLTATFASVNGRWLSTVLSVVLPTAPPRGFDRHECHPDRVIDKLGHGLAVEHIH